LINRVDGWRKYLLSKVRYRREVVDSVLRDVHHLESLYGKRNVGYKYSMNRHALEEVVSEKDLGVIFSSDLKSVKHCKEAAAYSKVESKSYAGIDQPNSKI